jgi:2-keto-3-deoxy-L-rhamnonate aldolase RhmA
VRLASELTGWKIDLYSSREWLEKGGEGPLFAPLPEDEAEADVPLTEIDGLETATLAVLSEAGYNTLNDILDLKNVDIFFFGLFDISRSYNLLGDVRNKEIVKDVRLYMEKIKSRGKIVGFIINNVNDIADFKEYGTYITYSSDVFLIKKTLVNSIKELKSI